jgi:hypothetical protein
LLTDFYCQHYGKSLSLDHWEETCDYYIKHFPFETYGRKWLSRKGRAIHTQSDFMQPLYEWGDALFANTVRMGASVGRQNALPGVWGEANETAPSLFGFVRF